MPIPQGAWGPTDDVGYRYAVVRIRTFHPGSPEWQEPLVLTLRDKGGRFDVVEISRPRNDAEVKSR